jgi:hypothetical protein
MARKTISVDELVERANTYLAEEKTTAEGREAICSYIEGVLFSVDRYAGFRYLATNDIRGGGSRREYKIKDI